ncbi:MAG: MFS transporter [Dehalococcoidia bacterium]|nr:MFS transporter [Dehalococcoidia bacterium]
MLSVLSPRSTLTEAEVNRSLHYMILGGMGENAMFALASGGFMAAFALALGANNFQIGILAALPFLTQVAQLPAILAVERLRRRKALGIPAGYITNLMWVPAGAVPLLMETPGSGAILALMAIIAFRGLFAATWNTAWVSWMSDLVPRSAVGSYYGKRWAFIIGTVVAVSVAASFFVSWWTQTAPAGQQVYAYSFLLIGGALAFGVSGPSFSILASEPLMPNAASTDRSVFDILTKPFRDKNFSHLVRFLFAWNFAANLAIPFFAVYMLRDLGYSLPTVIGFTVLSQFTNLLAMRMWGPFADRAGSKPVLSMSASLYLLAIVAWPFATLPDPHFFTLPLIAAIHMLAGIAAAGVTLTVGTLALKVAPEGEETPFLGVAGIATSLGIGLGPIVGGLLADLVAENSFAVTLRWLSPTGVEELSVISLEGYDFVFAAAFILGLVSLNLLIALREEGEVARGIALEQLSAGAAPLSRLVSSVPGLNVMSAYSTGYLKRVPGADVALGVTAYQVAASTRAAASAVAQGQNLAMNVSRAVGREMHRQMEGVHDIAGHAVGLARHGARGAVEAGEGIAAGLGDRVRGAVIGSVRALSAYPVEDDAMLQEAGYGVILGASNTDQDMAEAVRTAIEAAKEVSGELGLTEEEAASALAAGMLDAARAEGMDTMAIVMEELPDEFTPPQAPSPQSEGLKQD